MREGNSLSAIRLFILKINIGGGAFATTSPYKDSYNVCNMLARVLLGLAALHLGLSICLNNVCTLPQVCVDVAVECFGCDTVVSGKNLNYSDCPIVIRGFK